MDGNRGAVVTEELWYFLVRNRGAVVFLIKKQRSCGISY